MSSASAQAVAASLAGVRVAVPMTRQIPGFFDLLLCVRGPHGDLHPSALSGMLKSVTTTANLASPHGGTMAPYRLPAGVTQEPCELRESTTTARQRHRSLAIDIRVQAVSRVLTVLHPPVSALRNSPMLASSGGVAQADPYDDRLPRLCSSPCGLTLSRPSLWHTHVRCTNLGSLI